MGVFRLTVNLYFCCSHLDQFLPHSSRFNSGPRSSLESAILLKKWCSFLQPNANEYVSWLLDQHKYLNLITNLNYVSIYTKHLCFHRSQAPWRQGSHLRNHHACWQDKWNDVINQRLPNWNFISTTFPCWTTGWSNVPLSHDHKMTKGKRQVGREVRVLGKPQTEQSIPE